MATRRKAATKPTAKPKPAAAPSPQRGFADESPNIVQVMQELFPTEFQVCLLTCQNRNQAARIRQLEAAQTKESQND